MECKNILVCGGNGFIGGHLVEALAAQGHKVHVLDVSLGCWRHISDVAESLTLTPIANKEAMARVLKDNEIQIIYNLAGISHTVASALGGAEGYRAGVYGMVNMLDVIKKLYEEGFPMLERILISSSSLISGILKPNANGEIDANEPWVNIMQSYHPYVSNKIAMEMALWDHHVLAGTPVTPMRFGTAYGPRMMPGVVEHYFIKGALSPDKTITVQGTGAQWRQCLYVGDIVEGLVKGLKPEAANQTLYLVPNWKTTILEMAQAMQRIDPDVKIVHVDARPLDIRMRFIDGTITEKLLDWKATVSFQDGMQIAYDFHVKNPKWLK